MSDRSTRREVRNPLLGLPGFRKLAAYCADHPELRDLIVAALREFRDDCRERAEKAWRTHKPPMALYWKAVGVVANHVARVLS